MIRFLWTAARGYRLCPWRSPLVRWRIETFSGVKAGEVDFRRFWQFVWRWRSELWRFLHWSAGMQETSRNR